MPNLLRRSAVAALVTAGLLVPATSQAGPAKGVIRSGATPAHAHAHGAPKARAAQGCANADTMPTAGNAPAIRAAILCLHNEIRADHRLPRLRENGRLRRAALGHSDDMVSRGFFDHTTPNGVTMVDRIFAAHYASRNVGWSVGENLAWGTGKLATPREIMKAWMNSPGHRANILKRAYREVGIGVVAGVPSDRGAGATYTADFGVIRR